MLSFELWVCCCFSNSGDSRDWMRRLKFLRRYCQISLDPLIPYEVAAAAASGALLLPSRPSWQAPCEQFDKEDGFVADGANFQSTFLPASWHVKLVFDHRKTRKRVRKCRAISGESSNKKSTANRLDHIVSNFCESCFRGASATSGARQNAGRAGQNTSWAGQNACWAQKGSHQDSKFGAGARVQRVQDGEIKKAEVKGTESSSEEVCVVHQKSKIPQTWYDFGSFWQVKGLASRRCWNPGACSSLARSMMIWPRQR